MHIIVTCICICLYPRCTSPVSANIPISGAAASGARAGRQRSGALRAEGGRGGRLCTGGLCCAGGRSPCCAVAEMVFLDIEWRNLRMVCEKE